MATAQGHRFDAPDVEIPAEEIDKRDTHRATLRSRSWLSAAALDLAPQILQCLKQDSLVSQPWFRSWRRSGRWRSRLRCFRAEGNRPNELCIMVV